MLWINLDDIYNNLFKAGLTRKWSYKLFYHKYVFISSIGESEKPGIMLFVYFYLCGAQERPLKWEIQVKVLRFRAA